MNAWPNMASWKWASVALVTGLLVTAAGCGRSPEDFQAPFFRLQEEIGLCGNGVLVDGAKEVWTEGGCENGSLVFHSIGHVDDEAFARIQAAFQALPAEPGPDCALDQEVNGFSVDVRLSWAQPERRLTWNPCTTEGQLDEPYKAAAQALQDAKQQAR